MSEYEKHRERLAQVRPDEQERLREESALVRHEWVREEAGQECCVNCGTSLNPGVEFCENCGASASGSLACPYCHQLQSNPETDRCMHCNRYIRQDICSFCGSAILPDANYCESCGAPHGEVTCLKCGTNNFTSFCSQCGESLTFSAQQLMQMFQEAPQYHEIESLSEQIVAIELELDKMEALNGEEYAEESPSTAENKVIVAQSSMNRSMIESEVIRERTAARMKIINHQLGGRMNTMTNEMVAPVSSPASSESVHQAPVRRKMPVMAIQQQDIEEKKRQIEKKKLEIERIMADFAKCPTMNPVEARNYYMAQKPKEVDMFWLCNRYGCSHASPKDCSAPQYGGTWHVRYGNEELKID